MRPLRRMRRAALTRVWALGAWWAGRRKPRAGLEHVRRYLWRSDTRRMNVRITELLRDRMRPRWLRIVRDEAGTTDRDE